MKGDERCNKIEHTYIQRTVYRLHASINRLKKKQFLGKANFVLFFLFTSFVHLTHKDLYLAFNMDTKDESIEQTMQNSLRAICGNFSLYCDPLSRKPFGIGIFAEFELSHCYVCMAKRRKRAPVAINGRNEWPL